MLIQKAKQPLPSFFKGEGNPIIMICFKWSSRHQFYSRWFDSTGDRIHATLVSFTNALYKYETTAVYTVVL